MSMNNSRTEEAKNAFRSAYSAAFNEKSADGMMESIATLAETIGQSMADEYRALSESELADSSILKSRGIRALSSQENKYYSAVIDVMKQRNGTEVKSALENLEVAMPETVLDQVLQDVKTEFPLLNEIDFVNASYMTSWIYNKQGKQFATWGNLGDKLKGELQASFGKLSATQCKLTAYMAVSFDWLDLGPAWLDRYVRAVLVEASGMSMELAIVDGAGNKDGAPCPIGMTRDLDKGTTSDDLTTYARKDAIVITDLSPKTYGSLLAKLAKTPTGRVRPVSDVLMVVNPMDYLTLVMPATTMMTPSGTYVENVLPVPTKIVQSEAVPTGHAVIGLAKQYIGLLGAAKRSANSKNGVITYDDSVFWMEDARVYKTRLLANGRPKDNASFVYCDISGLNPLAWPGKEQATESAAKSPDESGGEQAGK